MADKRKQKKTGKKVPAKQLTSHRLLKLGVIAFALFVAVRFLIQQPLLNQYDDQIAQLEAKLEEQKQREEQINYLKELYETDEYKERLARERLGLVSPEERVFVDISGQ